MAGRPSMCGKCGSCKRCQKAEYQRAWALGNRDRIKNYNDDESRYRANRRTVLKRYGLTEEDYEHMFTEQGGVCAICGNPEAHTSSKGRRVKMLAIDHDHSTGNIRGLLCNNCNRAIGLLGDDVDTLLNAVEYLRSHGVKY